MAGWVAKDVCEVLGTRTKDLRKILDPDEVREIPNADNIVIGNIIEYSVDARASSVPLDRGGKSPLLVSEAGLYSLMLRSRKPMARKFKRWVMHEVIPSIRKHGVLRLTTIVG